MSVSFLFQTFPEPLFFNKATGSFEILTDAKQKLVREIKSAVRAGRRQKAIYHAARNHSFRSIPLIPIEMTPGTEEKEIDTAFTVEVYVYEPFICSQTLYIITGKFQKGKTKSVVRYCC